MNLSFIFVVNYSPLKVILKSLCTKSYGHHKPAFFFQCPDYNMSTIFALARCCFILHTTDLPLQGYLTMSLWAWKTQDHHHVDWCQPSDFSKDFGIMLHTFIALNRCCLKLHKSMPQQDQLEMSSLWLWEFTVYGNCQAKTVFPSDFKYYCNFL